MADETNKTDGQEGQSAPQGQAPQGQPPQGQQNNSQDALAAAIAALTSALKPTGQTEAGSEGTGVGVPPGPQSTGDEVLDGIVESVAMAYPKLSIDRAVGKAIESGDSRFIDEAYIREVAGKDADRLIKVAKSAVSRVNESAAQLKETVYSAVGGEQNWQTAVAAFNKGAPKELREAVAVMLDSGKTTQVKAAAQLVSQFASAGGFIRSNSRSGAPQYSAAAGGQGLSANDFKAEIAKLDRNSRDFQEKRADLYNRRALGRQAGL